MSVARTAAYSILAVSRRPARESLHSPKGVLRRMANPLSLLSATSFAVAVVVTRVATSSTVLPE